MYAYLQQLFVSKVYPHSSGCQERANMTSCLEKQIHLTGLHAPYTVMVPGNMSTLEKSSAADDIVVVMWQPPLARCPRSVVEAPLNENEDILLQQLCCVQVSATAVCETLCNKSSFRSQEVLVAKSDRLHASLKDDWRHLCRAEKRRGGQRVESENSGSSSESVAAGSRRGSS